MALYSLSATEIGHNIHIYATAKTTPRQDSQTLTRSIPESKDIKLRYQLSRHHLDCMQMAPRSLQKTDKPDDTSCCKLMY